MDIEHTSIPMEHVVIFLLCVDQVQVFYLKNALKKIRFFFIF